MKRAILFLALVLAGCGANTPPLPGPVDLPGSCVESFDGDCRTMCTTSGEPVTFCRVE